MQQRGSKYDQKIKDEALALIASGVKISNASVRLGIPKSTLSDWVHTQNESDEDGVAARREIRRKQIAKCERIVDKALKAIDGKVNAAANEGKAVQDGMKILEKAAAQGVHGLTPADVDKLRELMDNYTGVHLRELSGVLKDVAARQETLEAHLAEKEEAAPEINLQLTLVDPTKAVNDES